MKLENYLFITAKSQRTEVKNPIVLSLTAKQCLLSQKSMLIMYLNDSFFPIYFSVERN